MVLAPMAFFEFSYLKANKLRRLHGKAVEWDHNGEASKLIGIYVESPASRVDSEQAPTLSKNAQTAGTLSLRPWNGTP
jgi:hypothetical protein